MGNFYVNYTVATTDASAVIEALSGRKAFATSYPSQFSVVFDQESESQSPKIIKALGAQLSQLLSAPVLSVLNHDDDILWCCLFESGECVDEYDSNPDYFDEQESETEPKGPEGGNAKKLCSAFNSSEVEVVEQVLHNTKYVFAYERHEALVKALGLPSFAVASGFTYISQGELPQGLLQEHILSVP